MFYSERFTFLVSRRRSEKSEQLARDNLGTESRSMVRENDACGGWNKPADGQKEEGNCPPGCASSHARFSSSEFEPNHPRSTTFRDQEWVCAAAPHALGESHPLRHEDPVNLLHAFTSQSKPTTSNQLVDMRLESGCFRGWGPWSVTKILIFIA